MTGNIGKGGYQSGNKIYVFKLNMILLKRRSCCILYVKSNSYTGVPQFCFHNS